MSGARPYSPKNIMKCRAHALPMMNKLDTKNKKHLKIKTCGSGLCKARMDNTVGGKREREAGESLS